MTLTALAELQAKARTQTWDCDAEALTIFDETGSIIIAEVVRHVLSTPEERDAAFRFIAACSRVDFARLAALEKVAEAAKDVAYGFDESDGRDLNDALKALAALPTPTGAK
jgi:hypothetical protein